MSPNDEPVAKGDRDHGASWLQLASYDLSSEVKRRRNLTDEASSKFEAMKLLHDAVIGHGARFHSPFGPKILLYADWAASGRALGPVERHIRGSVLPLYANTHTTTSVAGLQSSCFRMEARQIIAQATNARVHYSDRHSDVVVFTGAGSTAAVRHLVHVLGLHLPLPADAPESQRPVVFVGPYEHHSNLLPWRESCCLVVPVPEDAHGAIDTRALEVQLARHAFRQVRIGSFSAASNVTGVVSNVLAVTELLHRHGALSFWDYAAGGPYLPVDMNPVVIGQDGRPNPFVYKDAVFLSMHKFAGGPGTPGLLIAKRLLFQNAVPSTPGGGTVFYVTAADHRYLSHREEREEGGTQDVVGSVRAGLVWQVREAVGLPAIQTAERALTEQMHAALKAHPDIEILGPPLGGAEGSNPYPSRLPLVSLMVRAPAWGGRSRYLHYSYVCALLNDVFGVQARGGCACAGPYSLSLLGISAEDSAAIESHLLDKMEVLRPGFVRVSLPYFAEPAELALVTGALAAIAAHGWRLLPDYAFNYKSGEWRHASRLRSFPERRWLGDFTWPCSKQSHDSSTAGDTVGEGDDHLHATSVPSNRDWQAQLEAGVKTLLAGSSTSRGGRVRALATQSATLLAEAAAEESYQSTAPEASEFKAAEDLRWFMLPAEAAGLLLSREETCEPTAPLQGHCAGAICPKQYPLPAEDERADLAPRDRSPSCAVDAGIDSNSKSSLAASSPAGGNAYDRAGEEMQTAEGVREGVAGMSEAVRAGVVGSEELVEANLVHRRGSQKHPLRVAAASAPIFPLTLQDDDRVARGANMDSSVGTKPTPPSGSLAANNTCCSRPKRKPKLGRALYVQPPAKLMSSVSKAIKEWGMIRGGDRLLLGLSGGKDSLALLHCLLAYQRKAPPGSTFEIAAATVDPMTSAFTPRPLIEYMQSLGVTYHYIEQPIFDLASSGVLQGDSICAFCARMKRGALYKCCHDHSYNVLALAQHLDDLAESFMMSVMFNGTLRTMKANYTTDDGSMRVIRPLIYARERLMREFSYAASLPVITENCPACFEAPKERQHVKKMLAREESLAPVLYSSLRSAIAPLMDETLSRVVQSHSGGPMVSCSRASLDHSQAANADNSKEERMSPPSSRKMLKDCTEEELLAELASRTRARRRAIGMEVHDKNDGIGDVTTATEDLRNQSKTKSCKAGVLGVQTLDMTLEQELEIKQRFCTSDGCPRPS